MPPIAGPSVPSASSILTPEVLTSLAPVLNPQQMIIDVSTLATPGVMSFSGNWTNTDNLVLISTNSAVQTATISAANILLPVGSSISTVIPAGFSNAIQNLNLSLIAQNAIFNAGQIVSAGNLLMSAPVIANVAPATVSPALASTNSQIASLAGNVSMLANTIINQSTIAAAMGNVNIASLTNSLAINNIGGTLNAANLNIGTQGLPGSLNIDILGGDVISDLLNIETGPTGSMNLSLDSLTGQVNASAGLFGAVQVANGALEIGNFFSDGDPYISNENGDIIFSGNTSSEFINVSAGRNVLADFSDGPVSIGAQSFIQIYAGESVLLDGVSLVTDNFGITLTAETGNISVSGSYISASKAPVFLNAPNGQIIAANTIINSGGFTEFQSNGALIPGLQVNSGGVYFQGLSGSINGVGDKNSAPLSFSTSGQLIYMQAADIQLPGAHMSSKGGEIRLVASNNIDLSYGSAPYDGAASVLNAINSEGTAGGQISLQSQNGSVFVAGNSKSPTPSISTIGQDFFVIADAGSIQLPGAQISTGGGDVVLVAANDVDLSYGGTSFTGAASVIDTSKESAAGGYVFLASKGGSVTTGAGSLITLGELAPATVSAGQELAIYPVLITAFNGVSIGDIVSPGGDVVIGAGFETTGSAGAYISHIFDVNMQDPQGFHRGHGSGGITTGSINIGLNGAGKANIYAESSNGNASFASVTGDGAKVELYASEKINSLTVSGGVRNVNQGNSSSRPMVFISSNNALDISGGILNSNEIGDAGIVGLTCSDQDGVVLGPGAIEISNNGSGNGGSVSVINASVFDGGQLHEGGSITYNTGGVTASSDGWGASLQLIAEGDLTINGSLDASATGADSRGGSIELSGENLNVQNAHISANGLGTGQGGVIWLGGTAINGAGTVIDANSETGYGGEITVGGGLNASNIRLNANGGAEGTGGRIDIFGYEDDELNIEQGDLLASAQGWLGGGTFSVETDLNLSIDSKVINVAPYEGSNGNGGSLWLRSLSGDLTTIGNLNVDGEGTGSGGEMFLSSGGGDFTIGEGGSKLFARSGTEGGDGGRIFVSAGKNLTIAADAVLNAHVRGEQGNGGLIELTGGLLEPGGVTIDNNIQVNGKGTGSGGFIIVNAADFGGAESEGAKIVVNGNLTANAGNEATGGGGGGGGVGTLALSALDSGAGGSILINLFGDGQNEPGTSYIEINGNLRADGGKNAAGGFISIAASGAGNDITVNATSLLSAQGGTESGAGGFVSVLSTARITVDSDVNVNARGSGNGGIVSIESVSVNPIQGELGAGEIILRGDIVAKGETGSGGSITIAHFGEDILRVNSEGIMSTESVGGEDGIIEFINNEGNVIVNATGKLVGKVNGNGRDFQLNASAMNQGLRLNVINGSAVEVLALGDGAKTSIELLSGGSITTTGDSSGYVRLETSGRIIVSPSATINADSRGSSGAGIISLDAGGYVAIFGELLANGSDDQISNGGIIEMFGLYPITRTVNKSTVALCNYRC